MKDKIVFKHDPEQGARWEAHWHDPERGEVSVRLDVYRADPFHDDRTLQGNAEAKGAPWDLPVERPVNSDDRLAIGKLMDELEEEWRQAKRQDAIATILEARHALAIQHTYLTDGIDAVVNLFFDAFWHDWDL